MEILAAVFIFALVITAIVLGVQLVVSFYRQHPEYKRVHYYQENPMQNVFCFLLDRNLGLRSIDVALLNLPVIAQFYIELLFQEFLILTIIHVKVSSSHSFDNC